MNHSESIVDVLKGQMNQEMHIPTLSKNALRLQAEVVKKEMSVRKVETLIKTDPALTAHVLKVANSVFYKGLHRVDTVKEAILRLGTKELGNVVMWAIHQSNFQSKDPFISTCQKRLWRHSLSVALGSQWLASFLELEDVLPRAFVAGLLHDMGILYLLSALEKVKKEKLISNYPTAFLMDQIIESLHGDQGAFLLKQWNLAEDFCAVAQTHHGDDFDRPNVLLVLVRLVDRVCHKMEKGGQTDDALAIAGSIEAGLLGVSDINLAELEIYLEDVQKKISLG